VLDFKADYGDRIAATKQIGTNLAAADQQALYAFLLMKSPQDESQPGQVLKNELLDALCGLNPPPAQLGDVMVQIYRDRGQDEVIRDYAVQHLAAFCQQLEIVPETERRSRASELQQAHEIFHEALGETDTSIAGTALLALNRLTRSEADREEAGKAALQIAAGNGAGELARITAFQVCSQLGLAGALPALQQAAAAGETIPLRISAVAALGSLGGANEIPLLKSLRDGPEERLQPVAQHALAQIAARENRLANRN
jgi:hypothetical protein